ncbi:MAG: T9SS type A sorting domain-containing protein [Flavobacteriaceae bacterium]|nr:T9SS type A sorting domain-containing protein [Flavobacteriaceae bacterium]
MKVLTYLLLVVAIPLWAQDGGSHPDWNDVPYNNLDFVGPNGATSGSLDNNEVYAIEFQSDGKILVGGGFTNYNNYPSSKIVRLMADGTVDSSFLSPLVNDFFGAVRSITPLADGRILITGQFYTFCSDGSPDCTRSVLFLNSNGSIATDPVEITANLSHDSHLQPDGKILVAASYNGISYDTKGITRFNNDGTVDTTFEPTNGSSTLFDSDVRKIGLQSDGKIALVGDFDWYNGNSVNNFMRLNADGTFDSSFDVDGIDAEVYTLEVLPNDDIIIGGLFQEVEGMDVNKLAKFDANGTLDPTYLANITSPFSPVRGLQLLPSGKLMVVGNFTSYAGQELRHVLRLNADGSLDETYFTTAFPGGTVIEVSLTPSGKLIYGGEFESYQGSPRKYLVQTFEDGILDASFNPAIGANGSIREIIVQPDGNILLGGLFEEYGSSTRFGMARIFPDGTIDANFDPGTGFLNGILGFELLPDGKILAATSAYYLSDGTILQGLIRLNSNGTLDPSFQNIFQPDEFPTLVKVQDDGKILLGGGNVQNLRLNADGSIDTTFNSPLPGFSIRGISIQPDGKIIYTGQFDSYGTNPSRDIVRIFPDGTFDASFDVGNGSSNYLLDALVRPDGKIVVCGNTGSFDGQDVGNLFQLNSDGSLDTSFFNSEIVSEMREAKLTSDGQIIAGGRLFSADGHPTDGVVRLNNDGTVDTTFQIDDLDERLVYAIDIDTNGDLVMGGNFTQMNGFHKGRINRVSMNSSTSDSDGDGVPDTDDADPNDPTICQDTDADGCDDCTNTGANGSGGDPDDDGDDFDGDGLCDFGDDDDDNDGTPDVDDAFPFDPSEDTDTDGDGVGNNADTDDDGDGQTDSDETTCGSDPLDPTDVSPDLDQDSIPDCVDLDIDGDGYSNDEEIACGSDPLDPDEDCSTLSISETGTIPFTIFPNPSHGITEMIFDVPVSRIDVFDIHGKKLITYVPDSKQFQLNLEHLNSGTYLLKMEVDGNFFTRQIILK